MGRGLQSFVFASEDGHYVVKVFNNRYQHKVQLFSLLSHFPLIQYWAKQRAAYFDKKLKRTFASYRIAQEEMAEQTGLVYTHLAPTTELPDKLLLVDRLNICHAVDPNTTGFLIQKRGTLVYPGLVQLLAKHDIDSAKAALDSLVSLFFWKWRQGIADNDPLIRTNYALLNGKAIQIDVGPLSKEGVPFSKERCRNEIDRITASLKNWLNENGPELLPVLEAAVDRELIQSVSFEE
ncbi:MAG: hypothetical protein HYX67_14650 [Candidatus Melainabacteria bacterium]|nr:hypothetical protein [Candidatus Melainabacteria bacterium]